jgi:hypothetical protein
MSKDLSHARLDKILQIMPAEPGWRAILEVGGTPTEFPLVCWALVRVSHYDENALPSHHSTTVAGVIASGEGTEVIEHWSTRPGGRVLFWAYLRPGQVLEDLGPPPSKRIG